MPTPEIVAGLMPQLKEDLARLVAIPSVSSPGFREPREALVAAHEEVVRLFHGAGIEDIRVLELPDTAPVVIGDIPAPADAPTVLLYAHYDVVGAGDELAWDSPPFTAVERDGAIYGRGTADTKSNILMHVGALRAWEGRPPVGIKVVIEGQEEAGSAFNGYPISNPEVFEADAMVIADMGSVAPGVPALTVALRGVSVITVEATTLGGPKHSGEYGGPAPDALICLLHALASLHDERGDVAVAGLWREEWGGSGYDEEEFRALAGVLPGVPLFGTGGLGSRLWTGPAITVTGIDVPTVENAVNAVCAHARARLNLRTHPAQDAGEAVAALTSHLQALQPFGVELQVREGPMTAAGFAAQDSGPAYQAAREAMAAAWQREAATVASGAAIPVVIALHAAVPDAEILILGTTDGAANIHAPNERVRLDEFERATLAHADFFGRYAALWSP